MAHIASINSRNNIDSPKDSVRKSNLEVIERSKPEKIRAELNVEKWPAIWQPAKSKNKPHLRVFEREIKAEDGSRIVARLEISFNHLGTLTTEEGKMFRALIKQWECAGRPRSQVFFSDRELARILRKKWGTNVIESITKSLRKLRTISLEWVNSYYDKTQDGRMLRQRQPMTFLSELKIIERAEDGAVNSARGYFRFDDNLLANLIANHTKPFLIDEFFEIKTDIGLLLYGHIDLIMANKYRYERCTKELFEDLGLQNAEYQLMNKRKRALEMSLKELVGRRISSGVIASAIVEKTKDKKDYKIVIEKTSTRSVAVPELDAKPATIGSTPHGKHDEVIERQAEVLVCRFQKLFHGIDNHRPQSKEISQAISLIATIGFEQASYVIEFSRTAADETKYKPQTFGGILHYTSRAATHFEEQRVAKARTRQFEAERAKRAQFEEAYDVYLRTAIDGYLADPAHEPEIAKLFAEQLTLATKKYPGMTPDQHRNLAKGAVRSEIKERLSLLSLEDFALKQSP